MRKTLQDGPEAVPKPEGNGANWFGELVGSRKFTPKGRQVIDFIAANPELASFSPASRLAQEVQVNVATVVRAAQALGFSGWPEFQLNLRHRYLGTLRLAEVTRRQETKGPRSPAEEAFHRDIANLHGALGSVDANQVRAVAETIAEAPRTLIISSGSYGAVAHVLSHHASFMGFNITSELRGGPHVVSAVSPLRPGDCLVAISFWRLVREIVVATRHCRDQNVRTVAITDSAFSPLAGVADYPLVVPSESISFFQSATAAMSLTYGLLAELKEIGGQRVDRLIATNSDFLQEMDVLFDGAATQPPTKGE